LAALKHRLVHDVVRSIVKAQASVGSADIAGQQQIA
jgi:hypothetical protein